MCKKFRIIALFFCGVPFIFVTAKSKFTHMGWPCGPYARAHTHMHNSEQRRSPPMPWSELSLNVLPKDIRLSPISSTYGVNI